jgi:nitrogen fixation protein FixH
MATDRRLGAGPFVLGAILAAMISVLVGVYWLATSYPVELVADDPYEAGLRYNERIAAQQRATALGLDLALETTRIAHGVHVRMTVSSSRGPLPSDLRASVRRERPTASGYDEEYPLAGKDGVFSGDVTIPLPGRWHLVARASTGEAAIERRFTLEIP